MKTRFQVGMIKDGNYWKIIETDNKEEAWSLYSTSEEDPKRIRPWIKERGNYIMKKRQPLANHHPGEMPDFSEYEKA